jgi:hypothetical protein
MLPRLLLTLLLIILTSCSATRTPQPIGLVPLGREVTAEDEQYGHTVLNDLTKQYREYQ